MKKWLVIWLLLHLNLCAQNTATVTTLVPALYESSGLIVLKGQLITHNDGGGEAALFEIDTVTGSYSRKVVLGNSTNIDWEDIAIDSTYIYVGDFGNNNGNRTNLRIYRVLIADYVSAQNDTVQAEVIEYSYADQTDFSYSQYTTNFDAEAMIVSDEILYIFTKNWGNQKTYIYAVPNQTGVYSVARLDSLNPEGLITGATYHAWSQTLVLCGYQTSPFIYKSSGHSPPYFSDVTYQKSNLTVQNSIQVEGITFFDDSFYLSAEQNPLGSASLYRFSLSSTLGVKFNQLISFNVYPNPSSGFLRIETGYEDFEISIFDLQGKLILKSTNYDINCTGLDRGLYVIQCQGLGKKDVLQYQSIILN